MVYSEIQATTFKTKSLAVGLQANGLLQGINL